MPAVLSQVGESETRSLIAAPTCCQSVLTWGPGASRRNRARCVYPRAPAIGAGTTRIASPPIFGKLTTIASGCAENCDSKEDESGRDRANEPLSVRTNSKGRLQVWRVSGGVSQKNA